MQSTRVLRRSVLAAALAGIAAATTAAGPAFADEATGSLSGVVHDTRGAVVPDAAMSCPGHNCPGQLMHCGMVRIVDGIQVSRWFAEYLDAFAACGRGESDIAALLDFYAVPLLITTDDGFFALTSGDQVVATVQQQVDEMRAASYRRSEIKTEKVTVLNATSALFEGTISRQRDDGGEIGRLTATYLVTEGKDGRRISVLAVHGRP